MDMASVVTPLIGGALIGLAATLLLLFNGQVAGISGILGALLRKPQRGDIAWRIVFTAALAGGGFALHAIMPDAFVISIQRSTGAILFAGLLVGIGTQLGNGCTSGHGVCGISRLSPRSILATVIFIFFGFLVVTFLNLQLGGSL